MSQSVQQFWQLLAESGLLTKAQCNGQAIAFSEAHGGRGPESAEQLRKFLIDTSAITEYHGKVLSAGAAGPFDYGDYRVTDRVADGPLKGMFRAEHRSTGHKVGLWFLPADAKEKEVAKVQKRAEYHQEIRSPYMSESYGLVEVDATRFVVIENLNGAPLASQLKRKLSAGEACRVAREVAEGILPLHEKGCPHANVLAKNILVSDSGNARLLSFPLCDVPAGPEKDAPSPVEDIRALGRLLLALIDGSSSKTREEMTKRLEAIQSESSDVPPGVAKCIARMLGQDDKKLKHAAEVVVALAPFADTSKSQTPATTKPAFEAILRGEPIPQANTAAQNAAAMAVSTEPATKEVAEKKSEPLIPKLSVEDEGDSPLVRTKRRSSGPNKLVGLGIGGVAVVAIVIGLWASGAFSGSTGNAEDGPPVTANNTSNSGENISGDGAGNSSTNVEQITEQNVAYTGAEYWVSPTAGDPVDFRYLPIGAQAYLAWRPADWVAKPRTNELFSGIPEFQAVIDQALQTHCGLPPEKIESIVIGFYSNETPDFPRTAAVVRTISPVDAEELKQSIPDLSEGILDGVELLATDDMGYYIPPDDQHLLVSASMNPLRKLNEDESLFNLALQNANEPALVNREIALLQRASDADRLATLIFVPNFPFTEFKALWSGAGKEFSQPFREFFATDTRACSLSAHCTDDDVFFLELRIVGIADIQPIGLANMFQDRVKAFADQWENMMVHLNLSDYSRKILYRYPRMLVAFADQVEAASYRDHATLRCYLPGFAAENLVFATQLAMIESSAAGPMIPQQAGNQPEIFTNLTELLAKKKVTLEITRDTLDETINKFAAEAEVTVNIDGGALQLAGIAKNKSLGTNQVDQPAGAVLRAILNTADSRLVYVLQSEGDEETILVTTREAAEQRGDTIPPEFSDSSGNQE